MSMLSNLTSAGKDRKRVGRGGSRGGTSGRGNKGQKGRSGANLGILFEGGQMPLTRRLPKRGFSNKRFCQEYEIVNLDRLNDLFDAGEQVTRESLIAKGAIKGRDGYRIKILGKGALTKKLVVHVDACSQTAQEAIKAQGGEVRFN